MKNKMTIFLIHFVVFAALYFDYIFVTLESEWYYTASVFVHPHPILPIVSIRQSGE